VRVLPAVSISVVVHGQTRDNRVAFMMFAGSLPHAENSQKDKDENEKRG
jgi:hypothetical protein